MPDQPPRAALRQAWIALTVAVLAAVTDPLGRWWAGSGLGGPEWWGIALYVAFVVVVAYVVAPIALLVALAWFIIAWRRARAAQPSLGQALHRD